MSDHTALFNRLVDVVHTKVMPEFREGAKVTLLVRFDDNPEADVYVSNDRDFDAVAAAVERSRSREIEYTADRPAA